jgi:hypothetical protein
MNLLDGLTCLVLFKLCPAETYQWLTGQPAPGDVGAHAGVYMDCRGIIIGIWRYIAKEDKTDPSDCRRPDGLESVKWDEHGLQIGNSMVSMLGRLSPAIALHTWLATWQEWAQICNVDEVHSAVQQSGWPDKPQKPLDQMAQWVEYCHRVGGW